MDEATAADARPPAPMRDRALHGMPVAHRAPNPAGPGALPDVEGCE